MNAKQKLFVKDIMTKNPISVKPDDFLVYAAKILFEYNFSGLPVVNEWNELAGIITEYDLISRGGLHLPTLINVLGHIDVYKKDSSLVKDDIKKILIAKVKDFMNPEPLTVQDEAPIQLAAELFSSHHRVNPIPVIDRDRKLLGVISRFDLVKFFADATGGREVSIGRPEVLDKKVEEFIGNFEKKFVLVSKGRARFWPIIGLFSAIIGFVIAFAVILRLVTK